MGAANIDDETELGREAGMVHDLVARGASDVELLSALIRTASAKLGEPVVTASASKEHRQRVVPDEYATAGEALVEIDLGDRRFRQRASAAWAGSTVRIDERIEIDVAGRTATGVGCASRAAKRA